MILYDLLSWGKSLPNHRMLSRAETLKQWQGLNPDGLVGSALYYDAQVEFPERLVMANVRSASELGAMLYGSIHEKLLTLPDATKVYPAHGAGSLCGKAISKETVSTIGDQRVLNYALQPMSRQAFIDLVTADQPDAPPYFTYDAVLNSRKRPTLDEALARELKPLTIDEVGTAVRNGAQLLDTRDATEFAAAHMAGSINIGLAGQYATWAGTLLDPSRYEDVVADMTAFLRERMDLALEHGVHPDQLLLDPGPDFAKTPAQTVAVLRRLDLLRALGRPLLLAISRKDFLGAITGRGPRERGAATLAALDFGVRAGAAILRVHDVAAAADFLAVRAVLSGERVLAPEEGLTPDRYP